MEQYLDQSPSAYLRGWTHFEAQRHPCTHKAVSQQLAARFKVPFKTLEWVPSVVVVSKHSISVKPLAVDGRTVKGRQLFGAVARHDL